MNQSEASDVATTMMDFFVAEGDTSAQDKYSATFDQAREHLPSGALTALVQRLSDNAPMLVALKDHSLYLLTILEDEVGPTGRLGTNCTMFHVAPGTAVVEVEPRFRTRGSAGPAPRATTWRFKFVDGPTLEFDAHYHPEQRSDGREELGQALAGALGWQLPVPDSTTLVAAL